MLKLTENLLEQLRAWKAAGDREISINLGRRSDQIMVFIYDYSIPGGIHLDELNRHEDWSLLILKYKRNSLMGELATIEQKIGGNAACTTITQ